MTDAEHAGEEERLFRGYPGRLFSAVAVGWFVIQLTRRALPPLLPAIIDDLAISPARAGVALSIMGGIYALAHYPSGRLGDGLSRKTVIVAGLAIISLGTLVVAGVTTYAVLVVGTALIGLGAALYAVPMRALIADLFVEKRGRAFGVNDATGRAGNILAAGLAVAALSIATWQAAFVPVVVLLVVVGASIHRISDEPYVIEAVDVGIVETIRRVFGTRHNRWLVVSYSLVSFSWVGAFNFLPTFLQVEHGYSAGLASGSYALLNAVGLVAGPLAGNLGDRVGHVSVGILGIVVAGAGLAGMLLAASVPLQAASVAVFGVGVMSYPPAIQAYVMHSFPDASMGGDFGAFKMIYATVGNLGPAYVGVVAVSASYSLAFASFIGCLFLSMVILLGPIRRMSAGDG